MHLPAGRHLQRLDRPLDATPHEAFPSIAEIEQVVDFAPPRRGHLAPCRSISRLAVLWMSE